MEQLATTPTRGFGWLILSGVFGLLVFLAALSALAPKEPRTIPVVSEQVAAAAVVDASGDFPFTTIEELRWHQEVINAPYSAATQERVINYPLPTGEVEVKLSRHALQKHGADTLSALLIYDLIKSGQYKLYYSAKLGQYLTLVEYHNFCGGQIWFLDHTGVHVGYERTAFFPDVNSCAYWQKEIVYGCYKRVAHVGLS